MGEIPGYAAFVLDTLEQAGHRAYCVGGCVRDLLLGRTPEDWDVTTSALPETVLALFGDAALPTGLKHGTVTVLHEGQRVEVTTFRRDGVYLDCRHPEEVAFTDSLEEDLSRRDFTVNAMAMAKDGTVIDPFNGREDLELELLRCVGDPEKRFQEDALRIMRGLRFAATLNLAIEDKTADALHSQRELLLKIAPERIQVELTKLLCGRGVEDILMEYPDVLGVVIPEILPAVGFDQKNRHHCFTVWEHIVRALSETKPLPVLRYTMLFHDLGKPATFTVDEAGVGHFYGHYEKSEEIARKVMDRLRMDHATRDTVCRLVRLHDAEIPMTEKSFRRALRRMGEEEFRLLLQVQRADNLAQHPAYLGRQKHLDAMEEFLEVVLAQKPCFTRAQLNVKGQDLMALGIEGKAIGALQNHLLDLVVDGKLPNDHDALMTYIKEEYL